MGTRGLARRRDDDSLEVWRQIGDLLVRGQAQTNARFDRLESDVAELKTDVAELKTDVAELKTDVAELKTDMGVVKTDLTELKERFARHELAEERRAARFDAQFERLFGLIKQSERGRGDSGPRKRS